VYALISWIQLDWFLRLAFVSEVPRINLMLDGNMRDVIVNQGVTRPRSVPPLTNEVRAVLYGIT
jgi:hypothetical protein